MGLVFHSCVRQFPESLSRITMVEQTLGGSSLEEGSPSAPRITTPTFLHLSLSGKKNILSVGKRTLKKNPNKKKTFGVGYFLSRTSCSRRSCHVSRTTETLRSDEIVSCPQPAKSEATSHLTKLRCKLPNSS